MQRLPRSPPREPELMQEVASSFESCQGQKEERMPDTALNPQPADAQPTWSRTPGRESSAERSLAAMWEVHQ